MSQRSVLRSVELRAVLFAAASLLLTVGAAPQAAAQCAIQLTDSTQYQPGPEWWRGRPWQFDAVPSGAETGQYEVFMNIRGVNDPGFWNYADYAKMGPNLWQAWVSCLPPGSYRATAIVRCDGTISREAATVVYFDVVDVPLEVEILGIPRQPDGRYAIDAHWTFGPGFRPAAQVYLHEKRNPDGSYAPAVASYDYLVRANYGDRLGVVVSGCTPDNGTNKTTYAWTVVPAPPSVDVAALSGGGQRAVVGNAAELPLRVKFTASDPTFDVRTISAVFEVISAPTGATGHGVGPSDTGVSTTYSAPVAADGTASATIVVGDKEGPYVVRVQSPLSLTGSNAQFTTTAVKPATVGIIKDSTNVGDMTATYAVAASEMTAFHAIGLDASNQKIGPMKCNWSLTANGNGSTRGEGTLADATASKTTTFQPSKPGKMKLSANPPMSGIRTGSADLFITQLYVSVSPFSFANPVDQSDLYVPGALADLSSVDPADMPQIVELHVLTGASSRGTVKFELTDVTKYPGVAMNYPVTLFDVNHDLELETTTGVRGQTLTEPFSGTGDTYVRLRVRDYAAYGKLKVSIVSGKATYALKTIELPKDENGNRIADRGWRAESATIADTGLGAGRDEDDSPAQLRALPNPADPGAIGDNLTNFEEYRGFVLFDRHVRTNPFKKDLFIEAGAFDDDIQYAYPALPTATHRTGANDIAGGMGGDAHTINPRADGLPGASDPYPNGHQRQFVHRIAEGGASGGGLLGGVTNCQPPEVPQSPNICLYSYLFSTDLRNDVNTHAQGDPSVLLALRRAYVAHETGHAVNLYHLRGCTTCMMRPVLTSANPISTEFQHGVSGNLECNNCPNPPILIPVTGVDETDTLRIKP